MKTYRYIVIVALLVCCKSNASIAENVHVEVTPANQVKMSPTGVPERTPPVVPDDIEIHWQSIIQGNSFNWNGEDLFVQLKGERKQQGIFSRIAENDYEAQPRDSISRDCDYSHYFRLASVVGNIVGFEHETGGFCGVGWSDWRFTSLSLSEPGDFVYPGLVNSEYGKSVNNGVSKIVKLSHFFSEADILAALLVNHRISEEVSTAISKQNISRSPQSLDEFDAYFTKYNYEKFGGYLCFEKDYLSRFVFHHLDGEKVAVWISLTPTSGSKKAAAQQHIEILLPIPEKLKEPLLMANSSKGAFLMKDAENVVGTSSARFEFGGKKRSEK